MTVRFVDGSKPAANSPPNGADEIRCTVGLNTGLYVILYKDLPDGLIHEPFEPYAYKA